MAANDVSFEVLAGRTLGIVGESGSGKSVTLRALIGLVQYPGQVVGGRVELDGQDLLQLTPRQWRKRRGNDIAMVFQDPMCSLDPLFTVGDQLTEVLRVKRGLSRRTARSEAEEYLDRVGIRSPAQRLRAYPHELSGGMRQRVMIALAIAARPKLFLADEPTTALDVTVQKQILSLMADLSEELHMGTVLVSHDLGVVSEVCDDVVVMYAGHVVERGPVASVLQSPRHPYTEALANAVAQLAGPAGSNGGRRLDVPSGQPPLLTNLPPGCPFSPRCAFRRPECSEIDMHLDREPPMHATACVVRQRSET
jgi:oligopeptide/dipeptide ABC transporter ATP-binding protein